MEERRIPWRIAGRTDPSREQRRPSGWAPTTAAVWGVGVGRRSSVALQDGSNTSNSPSAQLPDAGRNPFVPL
jgi:hypothetical protein